MKRNKKIGGLGRNYHFYYGHSQHHVFRDYHPAQTASTQENAKGKGINFRKKEKDESDGENCFQMDRLPLRRSKR